MPKFTRIRDKRTGHEYSVSVVLDEVHEVLDEPADRGGRPLPVKYADVKPDGRSKAKQRRNSAAFSEKAEDTPEATTQEDSE